MKKVEREPGGLAETLTGTTTNDYVTILEWSCIGIGKKTIIVENTDGANTLTLKVFVRGYPNGSDYPEILYYDELDAAQYERDLDPADLQRLRLNNAYAEIVVQAKSKVADTHATYQVDYAGAVSG